MRVNNEDLLNALGVTSKSMATSFNMPAVYVAQIIAGSVQVVFTGTPAGAFKLQVSNDVNTSTDFQPTHWSDVTDSSQTISAAGNLIWNLTDMGYAWIRVVWTASGAGTAPVLTSARMVVKGV